MIKSGTQATKAPYFLVLRLLQHHEDVPSSQAIAEAQRNIRQILQTYSIMIQDSEWGLIIHGPIFSPPTEEDSAVMKRPSRSRVRGTWIIKDPNPYLPHLL